MHASIYDGDAGSYVELVESSRDVPGGAARISRLIFTSGGNLFRSWIHHSLRDIGNPNRVTRGASEFMGTGVRQVRMDCVWGWPGGMCALLSDATIRRASVGIYDVHAICPLCLLGRFPHAPMFGIAAAPPYPHIRCIEMHIEVA